jgi:acyl-CoA-binding protein
MIAAFLNLPEPVKWKRQFNVLENFTYDAIQNVKNLSEEEAAQEEVQETVNEEDN